MHIEHTNYTIVEDTILRLGTQDVVYVWAYVRLLCRALTIGLEKFVWFMARKYKSWIKRTWKIIIAWITKTGALVVIGIIIFSTVKVFRMIALRWTRIQRINAFLFKFRVF